MLLSRPRTSARLVLKQAIPVCVAGSRGGIDPVRFPAWLLGVEERVGMAIGLAFGVGGCLVT